MSTPTAAAPHHRPAALRGMQLLQTPAWNKGTAFTLEERTPLGRHIQLRALQDTNEILFYRLLLAHIEEMMPIVYTPVVAEACQ